MNQSFRINEALWHLAEGSFAEFLSDDTQYNVFENYIYIKIHFPGTNDLMYHGKRCMKQMLTTIFATIKQ